MEPRIDTITSRWVGDSYSLIHHPTGLKICLFPKEHSTHLCDFRDKVRLHRQLLPAGGEPQPQKVPEGIAHYLEHKLFESEEGDAFQRYAKTGANANAFTSFETTCYLFSCTDQFYQSLEILLDFVQHPYFTEETVKKETGHHRPGDQDVRGRPPVAPDVQLPEGDVPPATHQTDIAGNGGEHRPNHPGTAVRCYNTFYNLHNMVLAVAGNFQVTRCWRCAAGS